MRAINWQLKFNWILFNLKSIRSDDLKVLSWHKQVVFVTLNRYEKWMNFIEQVLNVYY